MSYLPEDLMVKVDVASMANSLEARSPFLDHKFIEFSATLPSHWKIRGLTSKYILKEAFKDYFPGEILKRGKQGFSLPLNQWFRGEWKDYLRDIVLSPRAVNRGYFSRRNLSCLIEDHIKGRANYGYPLWALLMMELWHRVHVNGIK